MSTQPISVWLDPESRRHFFQVAAKVFGAGTATAILAGQVTTPPQTPASDVDVLNYALTLEQLEAAFYTAYLGQPGGGTGTGTGTGTGPGTGTGTGTGPSRAFTIADAQGSQLINLGGTLMSANLFGYLTTIRDHELAHVQLLTSAIRGMNGTPVQPCVYTFPADATFDDFLMIARTLENVGVAAYNGAINRLQSASLRQTAAGVATVEARHAAFLNLIAGGSFSMTGTGMPAGTTTVPGASSSPFPLAVDTGLRQSEVMALASGLVGQGCGSTLPTEPSSATVSPNNTTVRTSSVSVAATLNSGVGTPRSITYRALPGGLRPAILQTANSPNAMIQFVNGAGTYLLQLVVVDANGAESVTPISLIYQRQ